MTLSKDEFDKMNEEIKEISDMKELSENEKETLHKQVIEKYLVNRNEKHSHTVYRECGTVHAGDDAIVNVGGAINSSGVNINYAPRNIKSNGNAPIHIEGSKFTINSSKTNVDNREGVMQRSNIGNSSDKPFSSCPYCGEDLNLPKTPKFCPHCGEQMTV